MEIKDIDELMAKMEERGIRRLSIKKKEFELELEREAPLQLSAPALPVVTHQHPVDIGQQIQHKADKVELRAVTSPIVGTFYPAPSPDDAPYVRVGDVVEPESIVCIIEAMKVMNEVKAGLRGKVVEVLLKSGDPVEYGTAIFRVE